MKWRFTVTWTEDSQQMSDSWDSAPDESFEDAWARAKGVILDDVNPDQGTAVTITNEQV